MMGNHSVEKKNGNEIGLRENLLPDIMKTRENKLCGSFPE